MHNRVAQLLERLRQDHPMWEFWAVHRAIGGVTWCARPLGLEKPVINAGSPRELEERLTGLS